MTKVSWVVVDASVVVRAVSNKNTLLSKKFFKLKEKVATNKVYLFSPPIFWTECANALRFSLREKEKREKYLQEILNLPIHLTQPTSRSVLRALEISHQLGDSVYDCWYHVTALWLGATFITADKKYYKKAQQLGSIEYWGE